MALTHLTHLTRVLLPFVASSVCVVWLTFSGTCTRLHPGSRGPNGMVPLPRISTFSAFLLWVSSAKCSVVVAIVVVQFLLRVSGSLGASRSFKL